jgi:tetratricopeptide (TPR) repeat protein/serine phosphatase RsbU (regulator of sigma subunit)
LHKLVCTILFFLSSSLLFSQESELDSLLKVIEDSKVDTIRINALNDAAYEYLIGQDFKKADEYTKKARKESVRINYAPGIIRSIELQGHVQFDLGNHKEAMSVYKEALRMAEQFGQEVYIANLYNDIAVLHNTESNYVTALDYYFKALAIYENLKIDEDIADCFSNISVVYMYQKELDKALEYIMKSLEIRLVLGDPGRISTSYNNLAGVYAMKEDFFNALIYYRKNMDLKNKYGDERGKSKAAYNLGELFTHLAQYSRDSIVFFYPGIDPDNHRKILFDSAYFYLSLSKNLDELNQDIVHLVISTTGMGDYWFALGNYSKALKEYHFSLSVSDTLDMPYEKNEAQLGLYQSYLKMNNYKEALRYYEEFINLKDSLFNEEQSVEISRKELKYDFDKRAIADSLRFIETENLNELRHQEETHRMRIYLGAGIIGFVWMLIAYRNKRNANRIISEQKLTVEKQKEIVEHKNHEITSSITYAKRLQDAILPPEKLWMEIFPESFILYQPKDIIAGDFFWLHPLKKENYDKVLFAAADCTGHGVPGAMVSIVCCNVLNRVVDEFAVSEPGKILDKVSDLVMETFEKGDTDVKDGMDISLCLLDRQSKIVYWAGANNPLWIIRNGEIIVYSPDKQPIGKSIVKKSFTTHSINIFENDLIYVFSDGYADQFGGPNGKKYRYRNLQNFLLANHHLSMKEQKLKLNEEFQTWKGNLEQIDDVCLIGVKI